MEARDRFSTDVLEFAKVRRLLRRYAVSEPGKACVDALAPCDAPEDNRRRLMETREFQRLLEHGINVPLSEISDLVPLLDKTTPQGTLLEGRELLEVRANLIAAGRMTVFLEQQAERLPLVSCYQEEIDDHPELVEAIESVVDKEGIVRDSASPVLARVRKRLREVRRELTERLERMIRRPDIRPLLQEAYVTLRSGRYVLPVNAKARAKIHGIVHDRSATGTTVYIEPEETVGLGNRLRELEAEEHVEVQRILRTLTGRLRRAYDDLRHNQHTLAHLDFTTAKARFSLEFRCCYPDLVDEGTLRLRDARHPLLMTVLAEGVVPNNLAVAEGIRGIVITGPNTGGKTVCVKLIGLVVIMAHCGLPVPCEDAVIPTCSAVLADIGDEQSIEQSLSTFSAHMARIQWILASCDRRSLVLLDELGAGTDPQEGGALGVAIARAVCARAGCVIMTTHLVELKVMAYDASDMENAAMLFDDKTLAPTYELVVGTAGRSNALAVAERLGMPESILAEAREALARQEERPEHLLTRLYDDVSQASRQREAADREFRKAEELRRQRALALQRAERQREDMVHRTRQSSVNLVREIEDQVKSLKSRLRALQRHADYVESKLETPEAQALRTELESLEHERTEIESRSRELERRGRELAQSAPSYELVPLDLSILRVGERVEVHGFSQLGEVMEVDPDGRTLRVAIGMMELVIGADRIVGVATREREAEPQPPAGVVSYDVRPAPPPSLDLIGKTVEEMQPLLEQYLEDAYLSECAQVKIVHGFGTGALRKGVREHLAASPIVAGIRDGDPDDGGKAVTVVSFKQR